jgi:cytochrome c peroxidase
VPTLRNVARTAPYFHDGSAATLEDAIKIMVQYQLGRNVEPPELLLLVAFLESLSADVSEPLL